MDHSHLQAVPSRQEGAFQEAHPIKQNSFRARGLSFLRQAGSNRQALDVHYMWQHQRDWLRYGKSVLSRHLPMLAPKPTACPERYHYNAPIENPDDFSFILVGDTGMNSPGQYLVSSALSQSHLYPSDFCMILGDVMYPAGGEESYQFGLLEAFKHYEKPILALPGNHDWYDNLGAFRQFFVRHQQPGELARQYNWQSPGLPNWFYYMDIGEGLRIICLDSGLTGTLEQHRSQQLAWLDHLLETAGTRRVILMLHHPMYSLNQRGHEKKLRALLAPRLKKANVAAVFSGHDHNYQHHYIDGCHHVIHGAGGATLRKLPAERMISLADGSSQAISRHAGADQAFSFIHCRWQNNQLTCTTFSAHELPGTVIDRIVL